MSRGALFEKLHIRCTKSILDIVILVILKDTPMLGGYDLIKTVYNRFRVFVSPGTIYPILSSLEEDNLIKGVPRQRKRVYKLTDKGAQMIEALLDNYTEAQKQIFRMLGLKPRV